METGNLNNSPFFILYRGTVYKCILKDRLDFINSTQNYQLIPTLAPFLH